PVLHSDLDAETAELAARFHLHVAEAVRIHVTRMRIEAGQHTVDGRFDELAVVGLFDVVGAHALEHVAEQIKLPIGVRYRRTCGGTHQKCVRLRQQQCRHDADQCTEENQGSFAHHPRAFAFVSRPPWTESNGSTVLAVPPGFRIKSCQLRYADGTDSNR